LAHCVTQFYTRTHGCVNKTYPSARERVFGLANAGGFVAVAKDQNSIRLKARQCRNTRLILANTRIIQKNSPGLLRLRLNIP
jgi:hypothetical protein